MARTIAKDYDKKRGQILSKAAKVFAELGYDRASMTVLARECGISKANIYHYYDGKEALLFDILDSYLKRLRDQVCEQETDALDAEARLRVLLAQILMAYQGSDHEHQVQINAMSALPEAQQKHLRAYQRDLVGVVSDCLAALAPEVFAGDAEKLRAATMSVFGMLNWYFMWNSGAGTQAREAYATLVADLALGGIANL